MTDLCLLTANALRGLVRRREASCREILEAHIERIDAIDPALNDTIPDWMSLQVDMNSYRQVGR